MLSDISDALSINLDIMSEMDRFQLLMSTSEHDCITPVLRFVNSAFDKHKAFDS